MISLAENSKPITRQKAVDTFTTATSNLLKSITTTTQQAKASIEESIEHTKSSLEQTLQTTEHLKNTTSNAMQTAIAASVNDWLQAHPTAAKLVQILIWATNHPIISLVILLFVVAIAWSLIKAISRLLEIAGLSILQTPFKLIKFLIGISALSLGKFGQLTVRRFTNAKNPDNSLLTDLSYQQNYQNKQQRLAEISQRLEAIRQEQNQLLQEAAVILDSNTIEFKIKPSEKKESHYEQNTN